MPCYLFTFHGYGTWLPDRPQGYVHRTLGLQKCDPNMAATYRANQRQSEVQFTEAMQQIIIDTTQEAMQHLDATLHGIACESTHVHVLLSWRHDRPWKRMRSSLQSAYTRRLNEHVEERKWWAEQPSRKRVENHEHFDHLMQRYLPRHRGRCHFPH